MPFTFSHPAITLPLTYLPKRWVSLTGLVVGSVAPDFEYFLRMKTQSDYSHDLPGVFWFDLSVGLFLSFIFHNIVRDPLFDNLPSVLKTRLWVFKQFDWNKHFRSNWIIVLASIIIGTISHIAWDGFTHRYGYFVEAIPQLAKTVDFLGREIPIYRLLQHSSTVIGGLVIAYGIGKLPADKNVKQEIDMRYWLVLLLLTLIIFAIRIFFGLDRKFIGHLIIIGISAALISLIATSLLIKRRAR